MRLLFLGDVVGKSGCEAIEKYLPDVLNNNSIDFTIASQPDLATTSPKNKSLIKKPFYL
jgi:calcineurin-like phosphoesterase